MATLKNKEERARFAQLLEQVATELESSGSALQQLETWVNFPWHDELIADAYHQLVHFDSDADIREQSMKQDQMQKEWLLRWSRRLRGIET